MKLAAKLILIFLAGVLAIVALFTWQTVRRQSAWERRQRETHAGELVAALTPVIEQAYEEGGAVTVKQAVEVSTRTVDGRRMRWVDGDKMPAVTSKTTARRVSSVSVTNDEGTRTAYAYVPLVIHGKENGAVEVSRSTAPHDDWLRGSIVASLLSLTGVAVFSAAVIYCGGILLVGRPLEKLIAQVNSIGEGELAQGPVLSSRDELGRLASAVSQMSHRLSEQRETIRQTERLGTVGTLAAGVAHELGTPLNVVSGRAGLISSGKLSPEEVEASARTIKTEADRMASIIRQLLDFARQTPTSYDELDLSAMAEKTADLMRPIARKSEVDVAVKTPESPIRVEADSGQVQQVLTNLITNAVAAMPDGGTVTLTVAGDSDRDGAWIHVEDAGAGIKAEQLQQIFEPFYTTKDVGQGTGLGLSIAYGIVKEHGGEITVDSEPGQTTFHVFLPSRHADRQEGAKP